MGRRARPSSRPSRRSPEHLLPEHNDYAGKNVGKRRKKLKTGFPRLARGGDGRLRVRRRRRRRLRPRGRPTAHSRPPRATQKPPEVRGCAPRSSPARRSSRSTIEARRTSRRPERRRTPNSSAVAGVPPRGAGVSPRGAAEAADARVRRDPRLARRRPRRAALRAVPKNLHVGCATRRTHRGKWHLMRLSGELAPSRKPYGA